MPIVPVLGPAGGGKSQWIAERQKPDDVVIDFSGLYRALKGTDEKLVRRVGDPIVPFVQAVKQAALREAVSRQLNGFVTSATPTDRTPLELATGERAVIIDPGESVVRDRLAVDGDELSLECESAITRWYR